MSFGSTIWNITEYLAYISMIGTFVLNAISMVRNGTTEGGQSFTGIIDNLTAAANNFAQRLDPGPVKMRRNRQ